MLLRLVQLLAWSADASSGLFCKSRGLVCQSRNDTDPLARRPELDSASPSTSSPPLSDIPHHSVESAVVIHHGLVHQSGPVGEVAVVPPGVRDTPQNPPTDLVQTLEDNPGTTTHSMGLAAEQDPYFMNAFRSVLVGDRGGIDAGLLQVYQGGPDPDDHPIHFLLLQDEFPTHRNNAKHAAADAIETLVGSHGQALIRLYFRHVHSVIPVISKGRFLRQYMNAKNDIPASLRGAVYALACVFWDQDPSAAVPCPFLQHELVNHAQESLRHELEAPNLSRLQASILLMHVVPPDIDSVETPYTWIMAAQATACAQMIGLHQDPAKWNIAPWEKKLRRKLWWASYLTDCWSSVCHGNPPHIGADSFNTSLPDLDDLRSDEDLSHDLHNMVDARDATFHVSDGARFLEMVSIARHLRNVLDCSW